MFNRNVNVTNWSLRTGGSCVIHHTTDDIVTILREDLLHAAQKGVQVLRHVIRNAELRGQEHLPLAHFWHFSCCNLIGRAGKPGLIHGQTYLVRAMISGLRIGTEKGDHGVRTPICFTVEIDL